MTRAGKPDTMSMVPSVRESLVVCVMVLIVIVVGALFRELSGSTSRLSAGWTVGGDLTSFYVAAVNLTEHGGDRLYDLAVQDQIYRKRVPGATSLSQPFPHPPFVAALLRPLGTMTFRGALVVFLIATLLLYASALGLLLARFGPSNCEERTLAMLAGLSFFPFAGYTWLSAQISVLAFVAVSLAVLADDRRRWFASGISLSLCLYKPTLLVILLPMLVVQRRFRQIAGFIAGALLLTLISVGLTGRAASLAFLERLKWMGASYTEGTGVFVNPYRFADINSFFRLLPYGRSTVGYVVLAAVAVGLFAMLVRLWWATQTADRPGKLLVWAATLTWTSVLNVYTSAYDTIIVVAAAILAVSAVGARGWTGWRRLRLALVAVYVAPWIAELATPLIRVQLYTLALAWLGVVLVSEAQRAPHPLPALQTEYAS